ADAITKADKSPVTIADFAAQAIVCRLLKENFPEIPIVAEESSEALQKPENKEILKKIFYYIDGDAAAGIDLGAAEPNNEIFWTLDPVDGTKGFLRGEQFAVALALIVKGEVRLGILGCPNLELPGEESRGGFLFFAVKGEGTNYKNIETGQTVRIHVSSITEPGKMRFVESYVSAHSDLDLQLEIARTLKMERDPVRMDSQVKYGVVASGNAEIYLRIPNPKTPDYREKIWDHAAGSIIIEEAGGLVTDIHGKKLDFLKGKTLEDNSGIFASVPSVHPRILDIIRELS
ncbi:MAG: 3'(2'),5'-bisphosphate nucleotidase, partial [bacterium]|nr:3'(2'),5'-bisphosphate nucleotidase [bacterium]